MSRHHDKLIKSLTAPGPGPRRTGPRTEEQVRSFVKGFGLSASATDLMVGAWIGDIQLAHESGWSDGYNSAEEYHTDY
jgi:hypothetical protein